MSNVYTAREQLKKKVSTRLYRFSNRENLNILTENNEKRGEIV